MIGRFGLGGGAANGQSGAQAHSNSAGATKSQNTKISSIANIPGMSMPKMKFADLTKKVSAGLNIPLGVDQERKAKVEAEEKKSQMGQALAILENASLQAPASHYGLILAYCGRSLSPIMSPGIKFTWFRMSGEDTVDQIEESNRAWYAPSADDIGCMICVQCEDNFDQGCSRYLECGPIRADQVLCSMLEAVIDHGMHESKEVCVSLGLKEGENCITSNVSGVQLSTVLDRDLPFLQLHGRSHIEIDEQGIFISIPTFQQSSLPSGKGSNSSSSGLKNAGAKDPQPSAKASFNTSRRGLRLPASSDMTVWCAQPTALLLRVPVTRKSGETDESPSSPGSVSAPESGGEDEKMRQFLNSSILSIPWIYEGHNLSPAAYIAENESQLSPEDRERIVKEAEEDSIIFANTVCALAEFISTLPEGTSELLLCFHCVDRHARDVLALSMRALACQPSNSTRANRYSTLPWFHSDPSAGQDLVAEAAETDQDLRRRLKAMEAETIELKRERNELMNQLLAVREDLSHKNPTLERLERSRPAPDTAEESQEELGANDNRSLMSKIIDLENKLNIASKKEAELTKLRADLEARNDKLAVDVEKFKRQVDDLSSKLVTIQALYDRQSLSMQSLEDNHAGLVGQVEEMRKQQKELNKLKQTLSERTSEVERLQETILLLESEIQRGSTDRSELESSLGALQVEMTNKCKQYDAMLAQMEVQLSEALTESKRLQRDKAGQDEVLKAQQEALLEAKKWELQLKESQVTVSRITAEMNHLQRKSESQARDLKRVMMDNAATIAEFEKALVRKSEECNVSCVRIYWHVQAVCLS